MVTDDPEVARGRAAAGQAVVLIVADADRAGSVGAWGPGRVAILLGDPASAVTWSAAEEMATELRFES
jgi:hypothetical protein